MLKRSTRSIHRTSKVALLGAITCTLLIPQGFVFADSVTSSKSSVSVSETSSTSDAVMTDRMRLAIAAGEMVISEAATPDLAKVKFSKEKAIAKVRELFPTLKNAESTNVTLGNNNTYPAPENQMVWDIQWNYQVGTSGYGFNSQVDAITGDLISTYISFPLESEEAYYPPKLSKEQALIEAKKFITKAAPSISVEDLQVNDVDYGYANQALFGPVQYSFYFTIKKNGIPSQADALNITINSNGHVVQFSKPSESMSYPSSVAKISEAEANKQFKDELEVGLYYIPIRKNNLKTDWILGYRPDPSSIYSMDASTGKRLSVEGTTVPSTPVMYSDIAQTKDKFIARSNKTQLSGEEAAQLVQKLVALPADYTLQHQSLVPYYYNPEQKTWNLSWTKKGVYLGNQTHYNAEVDADTGEIIGFRTSDFGETESKQNVTIPKGLTKLSNESAKQRSIDLINQLYANASLDLKIINHEDSWNFLAESNQYRYEFQRFYKGTPVGDSTVTIIFDIFGRLQSYSAYRNAGLEKVIDNPVIKVTKEGALESYRNLYTMKLQYTRFNAYNYNYSSANTKTELKLVYTPEPADPIRSYQVLDAVTGKWVTQYENIGKANGTITPTDLLGHEAEKALTTLVDYGILMPDQDGKIKPDEVITIGDWLSMIVKSITPYYESYNYSAEQKPVAGVDPDHSIYGIVKYAVERQWIKNDSTLQPDTELTKEQLAVLLTSIVNYKKLALHLQNDTSVSQFSDANVITNKGAVAVAIKLGLLQGENGKFNPQQTVTRAQAAIVIMKLVEIQGKTDQTIGQR
ncbi:YcdB/YcdC domain-containing protein [Paenibacillus sp. FA6]|uniref:S-layer homology domain-containing protein n=1 Tax=Paenibacillus sp. FA6 TaxID=3413029 RepID=UPI003F659CFE